MINILELPVRTNGDIGQMRPAKTTPPTKMKNPLQKLLQQLCTNRANDCIATYAMPLGFTIDDSPQQISLAFGELERTARLWVAVFFAFNHTRIAGKETFFF